MQITIKQTFVILAAIYVAQYVDLKLLLGQAESNHSQSQSIAAKVDGVPIYVSEVNRLVQQFPKQAEDPQAAAGQQAVALEQLIHRRLVCAYLDSQGIGAGKSEIDLQQESLEIALQQRGMTIEEHLKQNNLQLDSLRSQWQWQIGWRKYLDRYLTDENLEKYFDQNKRKFDGTKLRVSHILIKVKRDADQSDWDRAVSESQSIRKSIVEKELSWQDAVKKHSDAASANEQGDAGWIEYQRPMPREFTDAAFALEANQISEPVRTAFGVHLIKISDTKPGNSTWRDVKVELKKAATEYLFKRIVGIQVEKSKIEFTRNTAYFEIQTGKLFRPENN